MGEGEKPDTKGKGEKSESLFVQLRGLTQSRRVKRVQKGHGQWVKKEERYG